MPDESSRLGGVCQIEFRPPGITRCQLRNVSMGLRGLQEPCEVSVFTDSKYVQEGMSGLVPQWKANRFRNSRGRHLANRRLWLQVASASVQHWIHWCWVKRHARE
jgi:ribonuclease HI